MDSPGDPAAGQARGYDVARGHEGPGHLYSDFDIGNVVFIEHDIVPVGAEVAVAEEGPDLVEHFFPQRRKPLPGGGRATTAVGLSAVVVNSTSYSIVPSMVHR